MGCSGKEREHDGGDDIDDGGAERTDDKIGHPRWLG